MLTLHSQGRPRSLLAIMDITNPSPEASTTMTSEGSPFNAKREELIARLQRHDMVRMIVTREVIANALSEVKISYNAFPSVSSDSCSFTCRDEKADKIHQ